MCSYQVLVVAITTCMQIQLALGAGDAFNMYCTDYQTCPDEANCAAGTGCSCGGDLFPIDTGITLEGEDLSVCIATCNPADGENPDCKCIVFQHKFACYCDEEFEGDLKFCETETPTTTPDTTTTSTTTNLLPALGAGLADFLLIAVLGAAAASSTD